MSQHPSHGHSRGIPKTAEPDRLQDLQYSQKGAYYPYHTLMRGRFVFGLLHNKHIASERKVEIIQGWIDKGYVYPMRVDSQMDQPHLTLRGDAEILAHHQQNSFNR